MDPERSSFQNLLDNENSRENILIHLNKKNKNKNAENSISQKRDDSINSSVNKDEGVSFRGKIKNSKHKEEITRISKRNISKASELLKSITPILNKEDLTKEISKAFYEKKAEAENYKKSMKASNLKESKKNYLIPEKSAKLWNKNVYWSKDKLDEIWGRIKNAKSKLGNKIESDLENLQENISNGEEEIALSKLMNKEFQNFYYQELTKSNLLEFIVDQNQSQLLLKIMADEFYIYDYFYPLHKIAESAGISSNKSIFHKFEKYQEEKTMTRTEINNRLKTTYKNIIQYDLYEKNPDLIKLLAFVLAEYRFDENFRSLTEKHKELFTKEKEEFNSFIGDQDIRFYSDKKECYITALKICLEYDIQDLAM